MTMSAEMFCFFEHLLSKSAEQDIYCFLPGSTADQRYLESQLDRIEFISKATLPQLLLTGSPTKTKVTFIPNSQSLVEGAIYKINPIQLDKLNHHQANSPSPYRMTLYPINFRIVGFEPKMTSVSSNKGYRAKLIQKAKNLRNCKTLRETLPLVSKL